MITLLNVGIRWQFRSMSLGKYWLFCLFYFYPILMSIILLFTVSNISQWLLRCMIHLKFICDLARYIRKLIVILQQINRGCSSTSALEPYWIYNKYHFNKFILLTVEFWLLLKETVFIRKWWLQMCQVELSVRQLIMIWR